MVRSNGKTCRDLFRTFDFANPDTHSPQRFDDYRAAAGACFCSTARSSSSRPRSLAGRAEVQSIADARERVVELYRLVLARVPTDAELQPVLDLSPRPGSRPRQPFGDTAMDPGTRPDTISLSFDELPHWTGNGLARRAGAARPETQLASKSQRRRRTSRHAATWPSCGGSCVFQPGLVSIDGALQHESEQGDGVEAHVVAPAARAKSAVGWPNTARSKPTPSEIEVKPGDVIDFVVTCRANNGFDRFSWKPVVRMQPAEAARSSADAADVGDHLGRRSRFSWARAGRRSTSGNVWHIRCC